MICVIWDQESRYLWEKDMHALLCVSKLAWDDRAQHSPVTRRSAYAAGRAGEEVTHTYSRENERNDYSLVNYFFTQVEPRPPRSSLQMCGWAHNRSTSHYQLHFATCTSLARQMCTSLRLTPDKLCNHTTPQQTTVLCASFQGYETFTVKASELVTCCFVLSTWCSAGAGSAATVRPGFAGRPC